jgi:DNA repair exonuclease SbcCD ATPase subunit
MLQRQQARNLLTHIGDTGARVKQELNSAIGCVQSIAGDDQSSESRDDDVSRFERATDHIISLNSELDALLEQGAQIGYLVMAAVVPIRELLSANREELENLARTMRSMKLLALNVMISAGRMPSSKALGALGTQTSEGSASVLALERELTGRFAKLSDALQSQAAAIHDAVDAVEVYREGLKSHRPDEDFRNSRRGQRAEVTKLAEEARRLQKAAEALVQSLKFVDEGTGLLAELDETIDVLLSLYPKSEKPFGIEAHSAGYTMLEQHEAHAMLSGGTRPVVERLTVPAEGQEYGDNVELF